jgi:polyferredoxin
MENALRYRLRSITQIGFFVLFVIAPPLDIFRYDLTLGHFIVLGQDWKLGLDTLHQSADKSTAAYHVIVYGMLPLLAVVITFLYIAWRWGRIYCGWLCPHFSVVETINKLMLRAIGKPSLWTRQTLPPQQADGSSIHPHRLFWIPTVLAVLVFAIIWSVSLLTYLLPPAEIYYNIAHAQLSRNQGIFLAVAITAFCVEFLLARHLFCRYGCAVGLFQSLAWMANRRAMVVGFDRSRSAACKSCNNACDNVCPMRLQPRTLKRKMFSCTECGQCITACTQVQQSNHHTGLLHWVQGEAAVHISEPPMTPGSDHFTMQQNQKQTEPARWKNR